ncbi:MAG TPA: hypothetical protein VMR98_04095 [Candidatus Polarisedimenticolaceae bacterium]|nr:hypothetical protein [Candidatus Polarisedimenticolaceae bacterium]
MDLYQAIQYIAAIIVIVGAGVLLGISLRRRQPLQAAHSQHERLQTYAELINTMDGLRTANEHHKADFISAYYRALVYAPDKVVAALNAFLQTVTLPESQYDPSKQTAARDSAVLEMRRDAQRQLDTATSLKPGNLYSIEINSNDSKQPVMKPESQVDTAPIMAEAEAKSAH